MDMDKFNKACSQVLPVYERMMNAPTENSVADYYIALAVNGLVAEPIGEMDKPIPQPICRFQSLPLNIGMCYIYPADQHRP